MKNEIITITTEFIRLDALLKLGGDYAEYNGGRYTVKVEE